MPDTRQIQPNRSRNEGFSRLHCAVMVVAYFGVLCNSGEARTPPRVLRPVVPPRIIKDVREPNPWIPIGKETSYVTQPIGEDGYIDYLAALNAAASEGVTVENNAAVLLVRTMEISSFNEADSKHFFKMLGIEPPPPDVDGRFPESSAFLTNQGDRFGDTIATMVPWSPDEFPPRATWLRKHEKALELAIEATRRSHCYFPLVRPADARMLHDLPLAGLQGSNEIARGLTARALLRIHDGKISDAQQDLLACHRLGRLVGSGPFLMNGVVGRAIEIKASLADAALLEFGKLSRADALAYRAELRKLPPLSRVADQLDHGERLQFLGFFAELAQKQQPELENMMVSQAPDVSPEFLIPLVTDQMTVIWDEGLRAANKDWDRWVAAVRTPLASGRQKQLEILETELRPFLKDKVEAHSDDSLEQKGRWMGRAVAAHMLPALKDAALIEDRTRMRADLVQLGCALRAYRADFGEYPTALDTLVPNFCGEVPIDRFTAKPLHYTRQGDGYLLYSAGDNAADDAGRDSDFKPPGDDIVIRVAGTGPTSHAYGTIAVKRLAAIVLALAALGGLTLVGIRLTRRRRPGTGKL